MVLFTFLSSLPSTPFSKINTDTLSSRNSAKWRTQVEGGALRHTLWAFPNPWGGWVYKEGDIRDMKASVLLRQEYFTWVIMATLEESGSLPRMLLASLKTNKGRYSPRKLSCVSSILSTLGAHSYLKWAKEKQEEKEGSQRNRHPDSPEGMACPT